MVTFSINKFSTIKDILLNSYVLNLDNFNERDILLDGIINHSLIYVYTLDMGIIFKEDEYCLSLCHFKYNEFILKYKKEHDKNKKYKTNN